MNSSAELKIPFKEFFEKYFKDESGSYPECAEGRVWFNETTDIKNYSKLLDKKKKIEEQTDYEIIIGDPELMIDCSIFKNLKEGVFVCLENNQYKIMMKRSSGDWKTIKELEKARYVKSENNLVINGYKVFMLGEASKFYAKRLADCINAYLNQNEESGKEKESEVASNSELVTGALDNIDERINEIKEKLVILQTSEEEKEAT